MAVCKSGWLSFSREEYPVWAKDGQWVHLHQKDEDWIVMFCDIPRDGIDYQRWHKHRFVARQMRTGTYEVLPHSPYAVFLRYISADTERKKPASNTGETAQPSDQQQEQPSQEPEFNPETGTAKDAREWLIWREYVLLRNGKVPQGWASVADAFLDRVKERDLQAKKDAEKKALTDGKSIKPKSEREMLMEIISSPASTPRDKMTAQARLNEIDSQENKTNDGVYAPEPIIKEL